jgi:hypothetical protein
MQRAITFLSILGLAATACAPGDGADGAAGGKADDLYEGTIYDLYCVGNTLTGKRYEVNVTYAFDPVLLAQEAPYTIEQTDTVVLVETYVSKDGEVIEAETNAVQFDSLRIDVTDDGKTYHFFDSGAGPSGPLDFVTVVPEPGDVAESYLDDLDFQVGFVQDDGTQAAVTGTFRRAECEFAGPFADL